VYDYCNDYSQTVTMTKPKVLFIKAGGTIGMERNADGQPEPSKKDYLGKVDRLYDIAELTVRDLGKIDSTDMETLDTSEEKKAGDRADIAKVIYQEAWKYDGVVVAHGTDTMAETAAALTYMVQGLKKPIVLTGSQRNMWEIGSDAPNNILTAVQAATMDIGEVVVAFGTYILRGTRVRKEDEEGYDAFGTAGVAPLGRIAALDGIRLADHRIRRGDGEDPQLNVNFDTRIFHYQHISGANSYADLEQIATSENNVAIILGSFGAGNLPSEMTPFIKAANDHGKPVIVYTKCGQGAATAGDMTLEALGQKLMYALGRANDARLTGKEKIARVESIIRTPYNHDITERRK